MEQQSATTRQEVRPYQHIYQMKVEWLELQKSYSDGKIGRVRLHAHQAAYYAMRRNVTVEQATKHIFMRGNRGLYVDSKYLRASLLTRATEKFGHYYALKPKTAAYESVHPAT